MYCGSEMAFVAGMLTIEVMVLASPVGNNMGISQA